jgi:hypothetical protein
VGEEGEVAEEEDWQLKRYAADMQMDRGPKSQSRGSFPIKPSTFCSLSSMWNWPYRVAGRMPRGRTLHP